MINPDITTFSPLNDPIVTLFILIADTPYVVVHSPTVLVHFNNNSCYQNTSIFKDTSFNTRYIIEDKYNSKHTFQLLTNNKKHTFIIYQTQHTCNFSLLISSSVDNP